MLGHKGETRTPSFDTWAHEISEVWLLTSIVNYLHNAARRTGEKYHKYNMKDNTVLWSPQCIIWQSTLFYTLRFANILSWTEESENTNMYLHDSLFFSHPMGQFPYNMVYDVIRKCSLGHHIG